MRGKRTTYDRGFQITRHTVRSSLYISPIPLRVQNIPTLFNKFEGKKANIALCIYTRKAVEGEKEKAKDCSNCSWVLFYFLKTQIHLTLAEQQP